LEGKNNQLNQQLAQLPSDERAKMIEQDSAIRPFEPQTLIKGQVTAVKQFENETFLQINVGSSDGVAPNMKFMVHRGNQFLGSLIVTTVDKKAAAGRLKSQQSSIDVGDNVLTGGL
jgi:hypothetical protein